MGLKDFQQAVNEAAKVGYAGTWLIIMPASGTVHRIAGRFFVFDMKGESGHAPFIMTADDKPITFDPRSLILNDRTLTPVWQPRKNLHRVHHSAADWYAKNPDVFNLDTPSGGFAFVTSDSST